MKEVIFFDVCGTLYSSNTTYDFYQFLFKKHKKRRILYALFKSSISKIIWKSLIVIGFAKVPRNIALSFLRNLDVAYVKSMAMVFVNEVLEGQKNIELHNKLLEERDSGKAIVLVSASIHPVVEAIAMQLGNIDFMCTTLDEVNGKYSGFVEEDIEGQKLNKVKEKYNLNDNITWFYTDNKEDLPLLMKVNYPNIVIRKRRDAQYWGENLKRTNVLQYEFLA